ncbi:MAG: hypothetical protein AAB875_01460, partial [Patescibacteria group bacterium]
MKKAKKFLILIAGVILLIVAVGGGAIADRLWGFRPLDKLFPRNSFDQRILKEESVVINVAEQVS